MQLTGLSSFKTGISLPVEDRGASTKKITALVAVFFLAAGISASLVLHIHFQHSLKSVYCLASASGGAFLAITTYVMMRLFGRNDHFIKFNYSALNESFFSEKPEDLKRMRFYKDKKPLAPKDVASAREAAATSHFSSKQLTTFSNQTILSPLNDIYSQLYPDKIVQGQSFYINYHSNHRFEAGSLYRLVDQSSEDPEIIKSTDLYVSAQLIMDLRSEECEISMGKPTTLSQAQSALPLTISEQ